MTLSDQPTSASGLAQSHTKDLLLLCKRLERAWVLSDILDAVSPEVEHVLGYPHTWLGVYGQKPGFVSILVHVTQGAESDVSRAVQAVEIPIVGDTMVQEIMAADHVW